ncbi:hypothetical protein F4679DRAFT_533199 [Xylaria curta]|nr:hypothetical protein F4679DRAFT_533199 [Xylaria curta]
MLVLLEWLHLSCATAACLLCRYDKSSHRLPPKHRAPINLRESGSPVLRRITCFANVGQSDNHFLGGCRSPSEYEWWSA